MHRSGSPAIAAILASAAAGPLFLAGLACAGLYLQLPHPIPVEAGALGQFLILLIPAFFIGLFVGYIPNLIGAAVMAHFSDRSESARLPMAWVAAGAGAGAIVAWLFYPGWSEPPTVFALVLTSAACAWICRRQMRWDP